MNVLREKQIPRRTFLRGCGAALALPLLDVMQASGAKSVQPPKRVAFFYTPNGVAQTAWHPAETEPQLRLKSNASAVGTATQKDFTLHQS